MVDQDVSSLGETLAYLEADRDARRFDGRRFDGRKFEDAVLRHAAGIPSGEVAECWRYPQWPERTTVGVPLPSPDARIDLVAVKRDGSPVPNPAQGAERRCGGDDAGAEVRRRRTVVGVCGVLDRGGSRQERSDGGCRPCSGADVRRFRPGTGDASDGALERERRRPNPNRARPCSRNRGCLPVQALRAGLPEHRDRWLGRNPVGWMASDLARATLVPPCGTGKTRVSTGITSELSEPGDLAVVLVPSIVLTAQVRRESLSHIGRAVRTLVVCSDATTDHVDIERDPNLPSDPTRDTGQVRAAEIGCRVTQNAESVIDCLRAAVESTDLPIIFIDVPVAAPHGGRLAGGIPVCAGADSGRGAPHGAAAAGLEPADRPSSYGYSRCARTKRRFPPSTCCTPQPHSRHSARNSMGRSSMYPQPGAPVSVLRVPLDRRCRPM